MPFAQGAYAGLVETSDGELLRISHKNTSEAKLPSYTWPIFFQPIEGQSFTAGNCVVETFCKLPPVETYRQDQIMPLLKIVKDLGYSGDMTFDS